MKLDQLLLPFKNMVVVRGLPLISVLSPNTVKYPRQGSSGTFVQEHHPKIIFQLTVNDPFATVIISILLSNDTPHLATAADSLILLFPP